MFRPMRRKNQQLTPEACQAVLERGTSGVLALAGAEGYPYAVPLSYVLDGERIIFHCAKSGHKLDAIAQCPKASFCVIDQDQVVPERFTTHFRSVIAFGIIRVLEGEEALTAVDRLAARYSPQVDDSARAREIEGSEARLCVLEMKIEHMTGKQAKEMMGK